MRYKAEVKLRSKFQWPISYKGQLVLNWCPKANNLFVKEGECLEQKQPLVVLASPYCHLYPLSLEAGVSMPGNSLSVPVYLYS